MHVIRNCFVALTLVALAGCAREKPIEDQKAPASASAAPDTAADQSGKPAGNFASAQDFKLPVSMSNSELPVPLSQATKKLTSDDVQLAILEGMGAKASDIQVRVQDGIVYLDGQVDSVADLQRANYIARAISGVIEVDQQKLKTRN